MYQYDKIYKTDISIGVELGTRLYNVMYTCNSTEVFLSSPALQGCIAMQYVLGFPLMILKSVS